MKLLVLALLSAACQQAAPGPVSTRCSGPGGLDEPCEPSCCVGDPLEPGCVCMDAGSEWDFYDAETATPPAGYRRCDRAGNGWECLR